MRRSAPSAGRALWFRPCAGVMRGIVASQLLVVAALMIHAATGTAHAAETITAIEISGNRTISDDAIRSRLQLAPGSPYDPGEADRSLRALHASGLFSDVRIERRGKTLVIAVVENPIVSGVSFQGNSALDNTKAAEQVELKAGARYTRAKAQAGAVKLRDAYRRLGRMTTTVEHRIQERPDGRVEVAYVIKEGEVTKVDSIGFRGNRAFSESQLEGVISTSESGWFDFLKSGAFYDRERLDLDRQLLRQHYLKHGYADAHVAAPEAAKNAQSTGYTIIFNVDEGHRYSFGAVSIEAGLTDIDKAKLADALAVKSGEVYNHELIEKSEDRLMLALSEQSKPFARLRIIPSRDPAARTIGLKFLIEDGPRIHIERIDIVGNTKTKDHVIRRELGLAEGEGVNAFLLRRANTRLKALGFFKSVEIKQKKGSADDKLILTVEVVEDETMDLSFGAGYSTSEGVIGDVSIAERNLLGNGQWLRLKLAGSLTRLQADIGFTEPRFLGTRMAAGFDLFYKDLDYSRESSYKAQKMGSVLRLGIPLSEELSLGLNYKFSRNTLYDVGSDASAAVKEAVAGGDKATFNTSSVGYSLTHDTRDNKKNPKSGVYSSLEQDLAGVGGDVRYIRSVGEARGYYAPSDSVTFIGRARGGTIAGWGGDEVSLLDMFYMGGESVRGFAPRGIGPRDSGSANKDALGGTTFYAVTAETRVAIPKVTETAGITAAAFVDAGAVWGANSPSSGLPGLAGNTASPRVSTGVGLVWDSPLGPLRLDYAVPLLKQDSDQTQALSFGPAGY